MLNFLDWIEEKLDFQGVGVLAALLPVVALTVLGCLGYLD